MTMLYDEVDKTYVQRWADGEFIFTEHKGIGYRFENDDAARKMSKEIDPTNEIIGYRLIVVPDTLTEVQTAVAALLLLTPEQRKEVFHEFCVYCGTENKPCYCMRDE